MRNAHYAQWRPGRFTHNYFHSRHRTPPSLAFPSIYVKVIARDTIREASKGPESQMKCKAAEERGTYATFCTLPSRMHDVQTRTRLPAPLIRARTDWRLIFQRRLVTL